MRYIVLFSLLLINIMAYSQADSNKYNSKREKLLRFSGSLKGDAFRNNYFVINENYFYYPLTQKSFIGLQLGYLFYSTPTETSNQFLSGISFRQNFLENVKNTPYWGVKAGTKIGSVKTTIENNSNYTAKGFTCQAQLGYTFIITKNIGIDFNYTYAFDFWFKQLEETYSMFESPSINFNGAINRYGYCEIGLIKMF